MIRSTCACALATLLAATTALAQEPAAAAPAAAADASATFEVAAIKPSNPDPSNPMSILPLVLPQPGGRLRVTNLPVRMLIAVAYETQDFRVAGGPPALMTAKYDITAKAPGAAMLGQKQIRPLLKNLLIERFKLKTHTEPREMAAYDLVIVRSDGRLGPDMKPSTSDCSNVEELNAKRVEAVAKGDFSAVMPKPGEALRCAIAPNLAGGPANISMHGDGQEIKQLIEQLTQLVGRPIRDKTGLTGRYDFDMKLDLAQLLAVARGMGVNVPPGAEANLPQSDGTSLTTALKEQLGLKLDSVRAPIDVLVIDNVEAPDPD
jgi:uncharacterized protein (TIGR03435 family)